MRESILDIIDIIATILFICLGLPIMSSSITYMTDPQYTEFESVAEKSLLDTSTELSANDSDYFTKHAIPAMFVVNQHQTKKIKVAVEYHGVTTVFEGNTIPYAQAVTLMTEYKNIPSDATFVCKDLLNAFGDKEGVLFYERRDS